MGAAHGSGHIGHTEHYANHDGFCEALYGNALLAARIASIAHGAIYDVNLVSRAKRLLRKPITIREFSMKRTWPLLSLLFVGIIGCEVEIDPNAFFPQDYTTSMTKLGECRPSQTHSDPYYSFYYSIERRCIQSRDGRSCRHGAREVAICRCRMYGFWPLDDDEEARSWVRSRQLRLGMAECGWGRSSRRARQAQLLQGLPQALSERHLHAEMKLF